MTRTQRDAVRAILDAEKLKRDLMCVECMTQYPPIVLQWDHVTGKKEFTLSVDQAMRRSMRAVREELAKCDLVCANCHIIRTHAATYFGDTTGSGGWTQGR